MSQAPASDPGQAPEAGRHWAATPFRYQAGDTLFTALVGAMRRFGRHRRGQWEDQKPGAYSYGDLLKVTLADSLAFISASSRRRWRCFRVRAAAFIRPARNTHGSRLPSTVR